jgi:hypothetical protein
VGGPYRANIQRRREGAAPVRGGGELVCEDVGQGVDAAMKGHRRRLCRAVQSADRRRRDDVALQGDRDGVGATRMAAASFASIEMRRRLPSNLDREGNDSVEDWRGRDGICDAEIGWRR